MISHRFFFPFLLLLITYSLLTSVLYAQPLQGQPLVDSLLQELPKAKDDTIKIEIHSSLALALAPNDSKAALEEAKKGMSISERTNWTKGMGLSYYAFAMAYYETSDYSTSLENGMKAFEIFQRLNDKRDMASALLVIGNNYDRTGNYTKCIENSLAALRLNEEINYKRGIGSAYNNIGGAYYHLTEFDKAIENYKKALAISEELNRKYGIASALDNIANVYSAEGKYDSANTYNLEAIKIFEAINHQSGLAKVYFNRASLLARLYRADSAYDYFLKALTIDKKLGAKRSVGKDYGGIGELYLSVATDSSSKYILSPLFKTDKKSLLQKSKYYLTQAHDTIKEVNDIYLLSYYAYILSETEEQLGNYRAALAFQKEYSLYNDSIYNDENKKKLAAMEAERLAEVKDKEIQLEASEIKRQALMRNVILVSVGVVGALCFLFIWLFNRRRKAAFDTRVMEVEMKALRAQMNPHFIFNSLHSINKYMMENDRGNASGYLSKFSKLMRLVLENSREQEVTLQKDLQALELYVQLESLRFQNRFKYSIETDPGIDKENTLIPPLLLQPFVENAIIHGIQSKENGFIKVSVSRVGNMMRCVVEDNGAGRQNVISLRQDEDRKSKSLGIKIINERLNIINQLKKAKSALNIFDLHDGENKTSGVRIELLLPLQLAF